MKNTIFVITLAILPTLLIAQAPDRTFTVRAKTPARATIAENIVQTGAFEAPETVVILPKVSGRLVAAPVDVGTKVAKGDVIAEIESDDYAARVSAVEASLANATATLEDAGKDFDRITALLKTDTATQQEMDKATAALARAKATVAAAEAELTLAKINFGETKIKAPFDGVIAAKTAFAGAMLSPATPVYTVVKTDFLKLFFDLPTTAFPKITPGTTDVVVDVDAYPEERFTQKIHAVFPVANGVTRTVRVELRVDNADGKFIPGMYAKGFIELNKREDVMTVDWDSVVKMLDRTIVYKVAGNKVVAQDVKLGTRQNDIIEVLEGVNDDDLIVFVGQHRLSDGARVNVESRAAAEATATEGEVEGK